MRGFQWLVLFGGVCGMTVGWRFGREVRRADSVFNSFLGFIRWFTEVELNTLAFQFFLSKTLEIPNSIWFRSKIWEGKRTALEQIITSHDMLTCRHAPSTKLRILITLTYFNSKLISVSVVLWHSWMRPWRHEEQTLTFLDAVLSTWEQTDKFVKCPTAPGFNEGSDKIDHDFKVGILNNDRRTHTDPDQSWSNPISRNEIG